jgi:hypothetical protein
MIGPEDAKSDCISTPTILDVANVLKKASVILKIDIESAEWPVSEFCNPVL